MANVYDDAQFDAMAAQMSLAPLVDRIKCPTLLAMGEVDELCPLEDAESFFESLRFPKELWVYENETHSFGSRLPDFYLHVADWLRDAIDGKIGAGHARRIDHPAR